MTELAELAQAILTPQEHLAFRYCVLLRAEPRLVCQRFRIPPDVLSDTLGSARLKLVQATRTPVAA